MLDTAHTTVPKTKDRRIKTKENGLNQGERKPVPPMSKGNRNVVWMFKEGEERKSSHYRFLEKEERT